MRRIAFGGLLAVALVLSSAQAVGATGSAGVKPQDVSTTPATTPAPWALQSTPHDRPTGRSHRAGC